MRLTDAIGAEEARVEARQPAQATLQLLARDGQVAAPPEARGVEILQHEAVAAVGERAGEPTARGAMARLGWRFTNERHLQTVGVVDVVGAKAALNAQAPVVGRGVKGSLDAEDGVISDV